MIFGEKTWARIWKCGQDVRFLFKNICVMDYLKEANVALTVCDKDGKIIDMNEKSKKTFLKPGREDLIGKHVLDCHPEPARSMLADMLEHPRTNAYTIEKGGVKKLIYQTPWYENGEYKGFMELSMEIPFEMKHAVRKG